MAHLTAALICISASFCLDGVALKSASLNKRLGLTRRSIQLHLHFELSNWPFPVQLSFPLLFSADFCKTSLWQHHRFYLPPLGKTGSEILQITRSRGLTEKAWMNLNWRGSSSCLSSLPQRLDCGHISVDVRVFLNVGSHGNLEGVILITKLLKSSKACNREERDF